MSRCVLYVVCGTLFLSAELHPQLFAQERAVAQQDSQLVAATSSSVEFFESHRLELGRLPLQKAIAFGADEPSPFFTGRSETNLNGSDWDFLWRNASRIPVTSIPEPGTGSLVIGGALLLCLRRMRKASE
jgi:hypothetical protein